MAERGPEPTRRRPTGIVERGRRTRVSIVRTAARLWSERGFDAVTVEDICSAAGIGRSTFYLHFESKEHLLAGLATATGDGVASDLAGLDRSRPLDERLEVFVAGVARRMDPVPKPLAQLVVRRVHVVRSDARAATRSTGRFADLLRALLADAADRGELVAGVDTDELGEILGALTLDTIDSWASDRTGERPLGAVLRARFALVVGPYRAPSGPTGAPPGPAVQRPSPPPGA